MAATFGAVRRTLVRRSHGVAKQSRAKMGVTVGLLRYCNIKNERHNALLMRIAISKGTTEHAKYGRYAPWLASAGYDIATVDLASLSDEEADAVLTTVDGILFSGGPDIHPARYHHPEFFPQCIDVDPARDEREFRWFGIARKRGIPILGICRGMQLANVAHGGTLIPHLEAANDHRHDERDQEHVIRVMSGSLLWRDDGEHLPGNSSHHQALADIAPDFRVTGWADDGTVEMIEWKEPERKPFFLGVQWHPERMPSSAHLSAHVARVFLEAVRS